MTNNEIKRLARRGGIKRLSGLVYGEMNTVLREFLGEVITNAATYCEHGRRMTVTVGDVVMALRRRGITVYGYNVDIYGFNKVR